MLIGIANPIPIAPWTPVKTKVLTPTTAPRLETSGPPEFPGLIAASVWIMFLKTASVSSPETTSRCMALTTPSVTVGCVS